jgi:NAD(P)-dependent dehydrogenase (short-subunit alcohol dehydrogenase family)
LPELAFHSQVALVTGAGGQIGSAYALLLAERGARIVVNDVGIRETGESSAEAVASAIRARGGQAVADTHNVVTEAKEVVDSALTAFGQLDILINNAGIWTDAKVADPPVQFTPTLDSHLLGTLNMTRAAWSELAKRGGRIVQTSSGGMFGGSQSEAYPIAKAGIFGSVLAVADSAANVGIRLNGILPQAVSPMMDKALPEGPYKSKMRRMVASDVAPFVALLCHESVPFHGMCFSAGGGHVVRIVLAHNEGILGSSPEEFARSVDTLTDVSSIEYCGRSSDFSSWRLAQLPEQ